MILARSHGQARGRLIQLDEHGYPEFLDAPVPFWLARVSSQAVEMCPALALTLTTKEARPAIPPPPAA